MFGRKHLNVLVELVHETLKTLDCARSKYSEGALRLVINLLYTITITLYYKIQLHINHQSIYA